MNFSNIFAYVDLAIAIISAITGVLHLNISATNPLTAAALVVLATPVLAGVQALLPKANIPPALVQDIAQAIADAVNSYYHPKAAA